MDKARFMGQMAAAVCHDMANVLATIQQASGLLDDYLKLARKESLKSLGLRPQFKHHEKFAEIIAQVQAQVSRGQDLCEGLGRLAHSPDEDQGPVDLDAAARLMAGLCARMARRCKTAMEVVPAAEKLQTGASLIEVMTGLYAAVREVLERGTGQGALRIVPGRFGADRVGVDIVRHGLSPEEARAAAGMIAGLEAGAAEVETVTGGVRLVWAEAAV